MNRIAPRFISAYLSTATRYSTHRIHLNLWETSESSKEPWEPITFADSHPPAPSPRLGGGEPSYLKVPLPSWEKE